MRALSTDMDLYLRGTGTLLATGEEYARAVAGAAVHRRHGVSIAVFPTDPERAVYNNALPERDLDAPERAACLERWRPCMRRPTSLASPSGRTRATGRCGPSSNDAATCSTRRRARWADLDDLRAPPPDVELAPPDWSEYLRIVGVPPSFLAGADPSVYHVLVARHRGESVATAMAYDHRDDCGIYNVGTVEHARRHGLATALTTLQLHDARARGGRTASLQSSPMADRVYARIGFRDLGRFLEYVPGV
jgi:ribosomal protein S18 acetylase RimI-like enzyme